MFAIMMIVIVVAGTSIIALAARAGNRTGRRSRYDGQTGVSGGAAFWGAGDNGGCSGDTGGGHGGSSCGGGSSSSCGGGGGSSCGGGGSSCGGGGGCGGGSS